MPAKIYKVTLTNEERTKLTAIVSKGTGNVRRIRRAQMLLLADENQPDGAPGKMPISLKRLVPMPARLNALGKNVSWKG